MAIALGRREFLATLGGVAARSARAAGRPRAAHRRAHVIQNAIGEVNDSRRWTQLEID